MNSILVNRLTHVGVLLRYIHQFNPVGLAITLKLDFTFYLFLHKESIPIVCPEWIQYIQGFDNDQNPREN